MVRGKPGTLFVCALACSLLLGGCAGQKDVGPTDVLVKPAAPKAGADAVGSSGGQVAATVHGGVVTMQQLQQPLIRAYGLTMLMHLVQLELVKQEAGRMGVAISTEDVEQERQRTIGTLASDAHKKEDAELEKAEASQNQEAIGRLRQQISKINDQVLDQFLAQQRVSRPEFDLVLQTNAYLRKLAQAQQPKFTEEDLRARFKIRYGEKLRIRHIECANLEEYRIAKADLDRGVPFADVARRRSRNEITRGLGGELPPFSQYASDVPQEFKNVAFALKPGEVSDPVQANGKYHLLQLVERIEPKAVKFENVRDGVEQELKEDWVQQGMFKLREQLGQFALETMEIKDPVLKEQFEARRQQQSGEVHDRDQIRQEMDKQRDEQLRLLPPVSPTSGPSAAGTLSTRPTARMSPGVDLAPYDRSDTSPGMPVPQPAEVGRPPATESGTAPDVSSKRSTTTQPTR